jgi:hypothetical protein
MSVDWIVEVFKFFGLSAFFAIIFGGILFLLFKYIWLPTWTKALEHEAKKEEFKDAEGITTVRNHKFVNSYSHDDAQNLFTKRC